MSKPVSTKMSMGKHLPSKPFPELGPPRTTETETDLLDPWKELLHSALVIQQHSTRRQSKMAEEAPSHQTISGAVASPAYPAPEGGGATPDYGPPRPMGGMFNCDNCGRRCVVVEWPKFWVVASAIFLFAGGLGLICLICAYSNRKLRCTQCGNVQPYPGGGGC